jgi:hypothetical protein
VIIGIGRFRTAWNLRSRTLTPIPLAPLSRFADLLCY